MRVDDAIRMYVQKAGIPNDVARAEVVKISMLPATGVIYWLGTREIWRLRAEEEERGASFSVRDLHDELLGFGSIPVPLASRLMSAQREGNT
jgi:uncharacterized protein (DUF885 family)